MSQQSLLILTSRAQLPKANQQYLLSAQEAVSPFCFCVTLVQHISSKKDSQYMQPTQEYPHKSSLKSSQPFLDHNGVVTVGGRLQQSSPP